MYYLPPHFANLLFNIKKNKIELIKIDQNKKDAFL
jgi:hypothetical protein